MATGRTLLTFLSAAAAALLSTLLFPALNTTWNPLKRSGVPADLVVMNATIYTSDPALPFAQAMAVRNGRILLVGSSAEIQNLIGECTHELNLRGKVVIPGLIDSHTHLISGGLQMGKVELRGVKKQDEFVRKVKEAVQDKLPGEWVLGGGWNNDIWGGDLPDASWIDDISLSNPVWLSRMDGHMGLTNSVALKIAGITNSTNDPIGGTVMKTVLGEPTGLLVDSAMKLILDQIPEVSVHERRDALVRAGKHALMRGVTSIVDFGRYFPGAPVDHAWGDLSDVYKWASSSGEMLIRVCLFFPMQTWKKLVDLRETGRTISEWIYLGGVKAFADGSLGSNSALFYEPYEDDPHNNGLQVTDFDWLLNATLASDRSGLQVAVHAIGDKANDLVLNLFNSVVSSNGIKDRRFRIEHAQHLVPGTATRFGKQKVIASVQEKLFKVAGVPMVDNCVAGYNSCMFAYGQPDHLLDDADTAEKKIGSTRAQKGSYLFQSLLSGGAQLAFGSDWPVADINPLGGIKTAMNRKPAGWKTAWIPSERVKINDALNAYTISAAYACFLDDEVGSLTPGKYADFVILPASSWDEFVKDVPTTVLATYVNGVQAYPYP